MANFLDDVIKGILKPIHSFTTGGAEQGRQNYLRKSDQEYKPAFMSNDDYGQYTSNRVGKNLQNLAGVGSYLVPMTNPIVGGAITGAAQGFADQDLRNGLDIGKIVQGGAIGGGTGAAISGASKLLSKLGVGKGANKVVEQGGEDLLNKAEKNGNIVTDALDNFSNDRRLNVLKRSVGAPAPQKLGGALLEKETSNLAKIYKNPINSADDVIALSQRVYDDVGTRIADNATQLSEKGVKIPIKNITQPLEEELARVKSPELREPINRALESIKSATDGSEFINPSDLNSLRREWGQLGTFNPFADTSEKSTASAFEKAYANARQSLKSVFEENGITDFDKVNKTLETAIKQEQWAKAALGKSRPTQTLNDVAQDTAIGAMVASGGNPAAAIPGFLGGKLMQSKGFENTLANGAEAVSNGLKGVGGISIPGLNTASKVLANPGVQKAATFAATIPGQSKPEQTNKQESFNSNMDVPVESNQAQISQIVGKLSATGMKPSDIKTYLELNGIKLGGGSGGTEKVSDRKILSQAKQGVNSIKQIAGLIEKDPSALWTLNLPPILRPNGAKQLDTAIQKAAEMFGRIQSGGAINKDEERRFIDALPGATDDPETRSYKLKTLYTQFSDILGE